MSRDRIPFIGEQIHRMQAVLLADLPGTILDAVKGFVQETPRHPLQQDSQAGCTDESATSAITDTGGSRMKNSHVEP